MCVELGNPAVKKLGQRVWSRKEGFPRPVEIQSWGRGERILYQVVDIDQLTKYKDLFSRVTFCSQG